MDAPLPKNDADLQRPLEHFRAKTKRLKVHPTESLLIWVVAVHFVFLPWAIGGMRLWIQWISLGLALAGFVLALIPRHYTQDHTGGNSFRLVMWPRATRDSSNFTCSGARPSVRTSLERVGTAGSIVVAAAEDITPAKGTSATSSFHNKPIVHPCFRSGSYRASGLSPAQTAC